MRALRDNKKREESMERRNRLEQLALASPANADCPDAEQLAAFSLDMLRGNEQLQVAAHVRACPICRHDLDLLQPPKARLPIIIASLTTSPFATALRGEAKVYVRQYVAADLIIDLTIPAPEGDYWRINGQVTRTNTGLANCVIALRAGRRSFRQTSDEEGFFTFDAIPEGRYNLSVLNGQVQVQIRDLLLSLDD